MRTQSSRTAGAALTFLALAAISTAVTAEQADPQVTAMEKEAAVATARAALLAAEAAVVAARVAPLKELAGDGKTTLGTGAGATESWILVGQTLDAAADLIKARLGSGTFLILAGDEALDFRALRAIEVEAADVDETLERAIARAGTCAPAATTVALAGAAPVIGAIGTLLRSTTDIQGIDVKPDNRTLVATLAGKMKGDAIVPASLTYPLFDKSPVNAALTGVRKRRAEATVARDCLKKAKTPPAEAVAALEAAIARSGEFTTAITRSNDAGRVRLADALALEALIAAASAPGSTGGARIVRLYIDKAGGTTITRKNLWTALGAKAVAVTGGLVASFVASDVTTGKVHAAGVVTCRTTLRALDSVHKQATAPTCTSTT